MTSLATACDGNHIWGMFTLLQFSWEVHDHVSRMKTHVTIVAWSISLLPQTTFFWEILQCHWQQYLWIDMVSLKKRKHNPKEQILVWDYTILYSQILILFVLVSCVLHGDSIRKLKSGILCIPLSSNFVFLSVLCDPFLLCLHVCVIYKFIIFHLFFWSAAGGLEMVLTMFLLEDCLNICQRPRWRCCSSDLGMQLSTRTSCCCAFSDSFLVRC
jgi:hypothetical protein